MIHLKIGSDIPQGMAVFFVLDMRRFDLNEEAARQRIQDRALRGKHGGEISTAHLGGHAHLYCGRGRAMNRRGRVSGAPLLIAPRDLNLFSDRLDDAREREITMGNSIPP